MSNETREAFEKAHSGLMVKVYDLMDADNLMNLNDALWESLPQLFVPRAEVDKLVGALREMKHHNDKIPQWFCLKGAELQPVRDFFHIFRTKVDEALANFEKQPTREDSCSTPT